MIRHLFKLVWNRKKTNLLIVAEIFFSFLVVFSVGASAIYLYDRYRDPLGFDPTNVWKIDVRRNTATEWNSWTHEEAATFARLLQALKSMDDVIDAAGAATAPYDGSVYISGWKYDKRDIGTELARVTPEFFDVMGLEMVSGRWLQLQDAALDWDSIVIDREMAEQLMGDEDPVGKRVSDEPDNDYRVVGVVRDFRRAGELSENKSYAFEVVDLEDQQDTSPLSTLLIKVSDGTPAALEESMVRTMQSIAHGWTFNVSHLETAREEYLKLNLIPLAGIGLVAAFLLLMVVLGLTGVMWQNVTRRTREIGLRRATGAHRGRIHRQIVGEVMVTASLGVIVGGLLAIQVPLVGPFTFVPFAVVLPALIGSAIAILVLAGLCGLYPGWSATRIHPAEALHYE